MRHKWDKLDDTCKVCGLKRRPCKLLARNLHRFVHFYEYFMDNKWIKERPECHD